MYRELEELNSRPAPFSRYTAADLWTDEHTSSKMLTFHLDGTVDVSSRKTAFIDRSVAWIISRFGLGEGKSVADFGCGPGLYTTRLASSGAAVTGIDFSKRSIQHAREPATQRELSIDYIHANYLELTFGRRFDLITMIMCDFCALSPSQRKVMIDVFLARSHLKTTARILVLVLDLVLVQITSGTSGPGPGPGPGPGSEKQPI